VLKELAKIKPGTVDLIFADPPYNEGINYGKGKEADLLPDDVFVAWCSKWIEEAYRVLAADGAFWLLISYEYADYLSLELRKAGFHRRRWVTWYETFGVNCTDNFNRTSRPLLYSVKNPKEYIFNADAPAVRRLSDRQTKYSDKRADPDGKTLDDVWDIPRLTGTCQERLPDFPTQLPLQLLRRVVESTSKPGDLVLDPFNGSGTTGEAAIQAGRNYLGIEKQEEYVELSRLRLSAAAAIPKSAGKQR
jgi:DNA modification methylase